jgi:hypothetical protein
MFLQWTVAGSQTIVTDVASFIFDMLSSDLYELRLIVLQFLASSLGEDNNSEDVNCHLEDADDESSSAVECSVSETDPLKMIEVVKVCVSKKLLTLLADMMMGKERNGDCLVLVRTFDFT